MENVSSENTFSSSKQDKESSELLEMSPDSIIQWRNSLALSDIGVAAKKIYLVLHEMHSVKLTTPDRLEMLETLRPTVSFICTHLSKHIFDDGSVMSEKRNKIALLIQTLKLETAEGYRIIIDQLADTKAQKKLLLTAIYRLMSFEYKVLTATYQLYAIPPEGLWHEMHKLYEFAEKCGLLTKTITHDNVVQIRHKNVQDAYKHCAIMSISNPFSLSQKEIQLLNYMLEDWITLVSIKPLNKSADPLYCINLKQDNGPIYFHKLNQRHSKILALDLSKLTAHIEKVIRLKSLNSHASDKEILTSLENMADIILLEKLYTVWTQNLERNENRSSAGGKLKVALGLSSLHYYISESEHISHTKENDTEDDLNEIVLSSKASHSEQVPVNSYICKIINQSTGGLCLEWDESPSKTLNALELIGFEYHEGKTVTWFIGSIQWLKQAENKLQVGVKVLSPYAKPIRIQLANEDENHYSKWMSALLLPELLASHQPQTLITPFLPFKEGSIVNIEVNGEMITGRLNQTLFKAHQYKQFTIDYEGTAPYVDFDLAIDDKNASPLWQNFIK